MNTQFILRIDKKNSQGRCPVLLIAYFDGLRLRFATGELCKPAEWNADKQKFRSAYPLAKVANLYLDRLTSDALTWWRELRAAGGTPTVAGLKAVLRPAAAPEGAPEKPQSVLGIFEQHYKSLQARGYAPHTLRQRKMLGSWLSGYERDKAEILDPATYDLATHDRVLSYLRYDRQLAQNTVASFVRGLKVFLRWCREERAVVVPVELRKLQGRHADVLKMWLTAEDLAALQVAVLPDYLTRVRDVLLFCCYTGLRYSDVLALQPGNLHHWDGGTVLRLVQTKTRTGVSIYLTEAARAILDKYAGAGGEERKRLLPVLANQVMNRYLKRVGKYAGLLEEVVVTTVVGGNVEKKSVPKWELLTTHTARHTFATQSLLRGMPVEVLQKVMGHAKIQTTLLYAKVVEDLQHQTMRRVWEQKSVEPAPGARGGGAVCAVETFAA